MTPGRQLTLVRKRFVERKRRIGTVSVRLLWISGDRDLDDQSAPFEGTNDHEIQQYARTSASGRHQRRLSARGTGHRYRRRAVGGRGARLQSGGVNATISSVTGAARQYLDTHPGANQAVMAAYGQPRPQAAAGMRGYFTAHPQEYYALRGILAPIGDTERQCNVAALSPDLESAYHEFMAG